MAGGGGIQEEQGFRGIRIPDGPAIFMGQGHLVVAIGSDSLEKTLTAIRNPPAGEASLRESDIVRRAATLVPLEPARVFGVSDSSRSGGTLGMLRSFAAAMVPDDVDARYRDMLAGIQKLLPSEAEMEGMFGVGATLMRADDAGVSLRSVWEMPAPVAALAGSGAANVAAARSCGLSPGRGYAQGSSSVRRRPFLPAQVSQPVAPPHRDAPEPPGIGASSEAGTTPRRVRRAGRASAGFRRGASPDRPHRPWRSSSQARRPRRQDPRHRDGNRRTAIGSCRRGSCRSWRPRGDGRSGGPSRSAASSRRCRRRARREPRRTSTFAGSV